MTHVRIGTLRLRIPGGDRQFAKALAKAVAARLAHRVAVRGQDADGLARRVKVSAPPSVRPQTWARSIVDGIAGASSSRGRR